MELSRLLATLCITRSLYAPFFVSQRTAEFWYLWCLSYAEGCLPLSEGVSFICTDSLRVLWAYWGRFDHLLVACHCKLVCVTIMIFVRMTHTYSFTPLTCMYLPFCLQRNANRFFWSAGGPNLVYSGRGSFNCHHINSDTIPHTV